MFETRGGWTVIVDDLFAEGLGKDEALGVVASALFSCKPIFVCSYEEWVQQTRWWNRFENTPSKAPLLLTGPANNFYADQ